MQPEKKQPIVLPLEQDEGVRVLGHRDGRGRQVYLIGGGFIPHWVFFQAYYDVEDGDTVRHDPVEIRVEAIKTGKKNKYAEHIYDVTMHVKIEMSNGKISTHVFTPEACREIVRRLHQLRREMQTYKNIPAPRRKRPLAAA